MTDRSDDEPRYFPDVVEQIVNAWRDLGPDGARGRVVVVSGPPQSGRSTVLAQVAEDLRRAKVRVVRRTARDGVLQTADDSGSGERAVQVATVLGAALQLAGAGLVGGLVALGAEIAATRRLVDAEPARVPSDPYVHVHRVAEAVRARGEHEPLALLIDDADRLDHPDVWWDALFGTTLPRLAARLPVLVVLAVERTATAKSAALEVVDTKLLPAGLAEEVGLPPLDPDRIAAALGPVDDAVQAQLRSLVYGRPAWLDEVWREWREQRVVVRRDGRWVLTAAVRDRSGVSLHGWVDATLRAGAPDGDAFWRAKKIVRTAALEGPRFTAEAVALVLNEDVEDLIDWIDDHLADPDGPSLLEDDGFVERAPGVEPPALRRYRFRSAMVAGVLRQEVLDEPDGKVLAGRYARALAAVYRYSSMSGIAWTISRLATTAGDKELAEYIWRRANRLEGVEAAARLARFLVDHLDVETAPLEELAATVERLNDLTGQLTGRWNTEETLQFCRCAERAVQALSTRGGDCLDPRRMLALRIATYKESGFAALKADQADSAVQKLTEAAELSAGTSNEIRTADLYRLLAVSEHARLTTDAMRSARLHALLALKHASRDASVAGRVTLADCLLTAALSFPPIAGHLGCGVSGQGLTSCGGSRT